MNLPTLTLVVTHGCGLCEDARDALAEVGKTYPHELQVLEAESDEGRALVSRYRPGMLPLLLVDGREFSIGRVPRKKLRREFERRGV